MEQHNLIYVWRYLCVSVIVAHIDVYMCDVYTKKMLTKKCAMCDVVTPKLIHFKSNI